MNLGLTRNLNLFWLLMGGFSALLCLSGCEKWQLEQSDFSQVEIISLEALSIDSIRITGQVIDLNIHPLAEHGFIWTTQEEAPLIIFNEGKVDLGLKTPSESSSFSKTLQVRPNTRYNIRAYITTDNINYVYSESQTITTGHGTVSTLELDYQRGDSLDVYGQLSGTRKGLVAIKHGFCWSTVRPEPTLTDHFVDLGQRRNDEVFSGIINGLENNTIHYIRAFALFSIEGKVDTLYGEVIAFEGDLNTWTRRAVFGGGPTSVGVAFSIGEKAYVGTGHQYETSLHYAGFWEYDPSLDTWTQKADFAGGERVAAVGLSVGEKGYIGLGFKYQMVFNDFWEYDPKTNIWTRKADFPGTKRFKASGFSIDTKAYLGLGQSFPDDIMLPDIWEYETTTDQWNRKANFGGTPRIDAVAFAINNKGLVGTGFGDGYQPDFWEYDPVKNSWTFKTVFPGSPRTLATGFSLKGKGYVGTGESAKGELKDFWEYDPEADKWTRRTNYGGVPVREAISFTVGDKGYIGTGNFRIDGVFFPIDVDELWEFEQ
ncbi:Kelch repeat-containing protein [Flavilitoribacter nigricans]|uniref:Galactose oxidase n=1 Tax=Flavilitoribacter nigricans (strain ATCC 23147 / DSM 23189 / NBRC 102662 / NCIMB 1420 / SS-2) TaxID=1122177 RepID=A0A2D0MX99_FLAN2|nr:hypothetical protein [Flavilitoribacter nigricans]PHN00891.1 hypothetical protein CRP01_39825 [Flavilitoribacter nigricans DSM 23189 = NBRC 102662]